jgi:hypothetical protein
MNKLLLIISLCITSHFVLAQTAEQKLVKQSFDKYKAAILTDKGDEAVKYVDSRTITYYGQMLELVKTGDSAKVQGLSIMDKIMVFTIRHRASKEDILQFDGKSLFVYAIKSGMVGKNSVANNSVGTITISGTFAKGQFVSNGKKTPLYFQFYKEDSQWKLDLTSLFPYSTVALKKMVEESGKSENEFIFYLLEMMTGRKPGAEIWQPVVQ